MSIIKFEVLGAPSRSKGWARYSASQGDQAIVQTATGNKWVGGSSKEAEVEAGTVVVVQSQVMLITGKAKRQVVSTMPYTLVAEEGAESTIDHRPGSQGQLLKVTGARLLA